MIFNLSLNMFRFIWATLEKTKQKKKAWVPLQACVLGRSGDVSLSRGSGLKILKLSLRLTLTWPLTLGWTVTLPCFDLWRSLRCSRWPPNHPSGIISLATLYWFVLIIPFKSQSISQPPIMTSYSGDLKYCTNWCHNSPLTFNSLPTLEAEVRW